VVFGTPAFREGPVIPFEGPVVFFERPVIAFEDVSVFAYFG
jgi:hypothetical protein